MPHACIALISTQSPHDSVCGARKSVAAISKIPGRSMSVTEYLLAGETLAGNSRTAKLPMAANVDVE
jgi:hypothetical protein